MPLPLRRRRLRTLACAPPRPSYATTSPACPKLARLPYREQIGPAASRAPRTRGRPRQRPTTARGPDTALAGNLVLVTRAQGDDSRTCHVSGSLSAKLIGVAHCNIDQALPSVHGFAYRSAEPYEVSRALVLQISPLPHGGHERSPVLLVLPTRQVSRGVLPVRQISRGRRRLLARLSLGRTGRLGAHRCARRRDRLLIPAQQGDQSPQQGKDTHHRDDHTDHRSLPALLRRPVLAWARLPSGRRPHRRLLLPARRWPRLRILLSRLPVLLGLSVLLSRLLVLLGVPVLLGLSRLLVLLRLPVLLRLLVLLGVPVLLGLSRVRLLRRLARPLLGLLRRMHPRTIRPTPDISSQNAGMDTQKECRSGPKHSGRPGTAVHHRAPKELRRAGPEAPIGEQTE